MQRSLLLPLCPKGASRQPRDRGNGWCPPAAAHVGSHRVTQQSTRRGHGPGHVCGQHSQRHIPSCTQRGVQGVCWTGGHQVRRWLSLSGQDCSMVRALFWCSRQQVRAPRCPQLGRAWSHGVLKIFPFVETFCAKKKRINMSGVWKENIPSPEVPATEAPVPHHTVPFTKVPGHPSLPGCRRRKLSDGVKVTAF